MESIISFLNELCQSPLDQEQLGIVIFFYITNFPLLFFASVFYQLSDIKKYSKNYIYFNVNIILILIIYVDLIGLSLIFKSKDIIGNIQYSIIIIILYFIVLNSFIQYIFTNELFYKLFNMILFLFSIIFISYISIYIIYIISIIYFILRLLIKFNYKYLLLSIISIILLILRFYHIYLIDGIYYLFIQFMPSILFVFAFGKLCISCFKSIKNKIHRPKTSSTPALDKMHSKKKVHEGKEITKEGEGK
ncbi:hypothetical protein [Helicobacter sp. 13S00482-2]|uniref:hypothetical protein n=1 Tax=Helicobacter sp. 13S00482-2 TaxID=1476200 RepID=UPI001C5F60F1|nr:hypothetical protein [Helicobacter sp. 13S00482-2]